MPDQFAGIDRQIGLAADTDNEVANRPVVRQLDFVDRHGLGVTLRGGRWDDADPDIAFDQAAHRVEAAQLDTQFEAAAGPFGLIGEKTLQRTRAVEADEIEIENFSERNALR